MNLPCVRSAESRWWSVSAAGVCKCTFSPFERRFPFESWPSQMYTNPLAVLYTDIMLHEVFFLKWSCLGVFVWLSWSVLTRTHALQVRKWIKGLNNDWKAPQNSCTEKYHSVKYVSLVTGCKYIAARQWKLGLLRIRWVNKLMSGLIQKTFLLWQSCENLIFEWLWDFSMTSFLRNLTFRPN